MTTHTPEGLREAADRLNFDIETLENHPTHNFRWRGFEWRTKADVAADLRTILAALPPNSREQEDLVGAAEAEVGRYVYRRIEALMDARPGTPESAELDYLATIAAHVEEYGEEACGGHSLAPSPAEPAKGSGELEPCPFCGAENGDRAGPLPWSDDERGEKAHAIFCWSCLVEGPRRTTEAGAIAAWNRRQEPEPAKGSGELKDCPFCGASDPWSAETIICRECHAEVNGAGAESSASVWNRRTGSEVPQGWRDIASVPDGETVFIHGRHVGGEPWWNIDMCEGGVWSGSWATAPTHWCHCTLPAPPPEGRG